jgi:hypothetical protein
MIVRGLWKLFTDRVTLFAALDIHSFHIYVLLSSSYRMLEYRTGFTLLTRLNTLYESTITYVHEEHKCLDNSYKCLSRRLSGWFDALLRMYEITNIELTCRIFAWFRFRSFFMHKIFHQICASLYVYVLKSFICSWSQDG